MTLAETMQLLESLGTEQARKTYRRHGSGDNVFGVSFANLGAIRKKIKTDHALAGQLWQTGNFDACSLATMIADPAAATSAELDAWAGVVNNYCLADLLARYAAASPLAAKKRAQWMKSKQEYVAQAGWALLALAAMKDDTLSDAELEERLVHIEKHIHAAQNRVRHAMNNALIAIGMRNPHLERLALAAAARIGKVVVDHGDTDCRTPDAAAYIKKAAARPKREHRTKK